MIKTTLTAAALGLMMAATPAAAGVQKGESIDIEYRDINLTTIEGQRVLERRIDNAARQVCRTEEHRIGTRLRSAERAKCFAKARATAKSQMASIISEVQRGG